MGHTSRTMEIEYHENDFSIKVVHEMREKIIHDRPLILRIHQMKKYNISARNFHLWV